MKNADKSEREEKRKAIRDKIGLLLWKIRSSFTNALFPRDVTCDICGDELRKDTRYHICDECLDKLPFVGDHICLECGVPITDEADYCIRCENEEFLFRYNRAPLSYKDEAKKLILDLKFGKKKYLVDTLGAMMCDEFLKRGMSADIVVCVPMTESEEKKRGFNQSELLARNIADRLKMPMLPALVKTRDTSAQKELKRKQREENLVGAFACIFEEIKNRKLLLVDDVFTTGATVNACTRVLIKAGAREVTVLTAAVTERKIPFEVADAEVEEGS